MRKTFDAKIPESEQRLRVIKNHTGHKHQKKRGPGKSAAITTKRAKNLSRMQSAKEKNFRTAASAFFRGERDTYPKS